MKHILKWTVALFVLSIAVPAQAVVTTEPSKTSSLATQAKSVGDKVSSYAYETATSGLPRRFADVG